MRTVGWTEPATKAEPKKIIEGPVEAPASAMSEEPKAAAKPKTHKTTKK